MKEDDFRSIDEFQRNMFDQNMNLLCCVDERSNDTKLRSFGTALHSLFPEGRYYLLKAMSKGGALDPECLDLQGLSRLYLETLSMRVGDGEPAAPFSEGSYRIALPLGVVRKDGWTAALCSLRNLNGELFKKGEYALDRQNLLFLSHNRAGVILRGFKSKKDLDWSTVRKGSDGYPVGMGSIAIEQDRVSGSAVYHGFAVEAHWSLGDDVVLTLNSDEPGLVLQLPLEISHNEEVQINGSTMLHFNDEAVTVPGVNSIRTDTWELTVGHNGIIKWPVKPFDPYNKRNSSGKEEQRVLFSVEWDKQIEVHFRSLI